MTSSASGRAAMTQADLTYLERVAALAADSGLYGSGTRIRAQLLMKLIYGRDLGIPISAALSGIDIYEGKLELSANLIAGLVEAHPHYAYAIVQAGDEHCELEFFKDGHSLGRARYGRADATRAGLAQTEYYRLYPSDMFFARAMTRGARRHCPGLGRGVAIYATGELAKPTPQPTPSNGDANGAATGVVRADAKDVARIRALAREAQLGDAELFNVLIGAGGGTPVADQQCAAANLQRALELLPLTLVRTVCETLRARAAETPERNGADDGARS